MSNPKPISDVLSSWHEVDAILKRQTGKSYAEHLPSWREAEGYGLSGALATLEEHREIMADEERRRLAHFRRGLDTPGARQDATAIIRSLAGQLERRAAEITRQTREAA